jgi:predicted secreted protein
VEQHAVPRFVHLKTGSGRDWRTENLIKMLKTKYLLLCASLLFTSTVFTACDDDDDSSSSSEKLLKSTTEIGSHYFNNGVLDTTKMDTIVYNFNYKEGKLIEINSNGVNGKQTIITYKGDSVIVKSTYTDDIIEEKSKIGNSGYIEWSESKDSYNGGELRIDTTLCSYNNGYLVKRIEKSNTDPCTAIYTYENGNLITENYKWSDTDYDNYSYYYTDNNTKNPIPNKSSFVDADEPNPTGSMYGKHSTNLPVKQVEKDSDGERTTYYTWTLDADGYPVKCEQKTYDSSNVLSDYNITTYTWQ